LGKTKRDTSLKNYAATVLSIGRVLVPLSFFLATALLFWYHQYPLDSNSAILLLWLSRLDPLMLLAEWRIAGVLPPWFWLPFMVMVLTLFFGRIFCGWICPVGGILARLPLREHPIKVNYLLRKIRYNWLVFLLILLLVSNLPLLLTPFHLLTEEMTRLWQGKMPWILSGMLLTGILYFPRFWCIYICPTGLLLAAMARWRYFRLTIGENCVDCSTCEKVCQIQAMKLAERRASEDCMLCGRCWQACPTKTAKWRDTHSITQQRSDTPLAALSRRQLFAIGAAVVVGGFGGQLLKPATTVATIRPPGALAENNFLQQCSRCGRCVKVCPAECLFPMSLDTGLHTFLTPRVVPRKARCELCLSCQEVCPTGAIARIPLERVKMGIGELIRAKCLVWSEQKLCLLCREQCPVHAIEVDEQNRPYVNETACVGCGACENGCPLPEASIIVRPISK
jgi:polyferredoxin